MAQISNLTAQIKTQIPYLQNQIDLLQNQVSQLNETVAMKAVDYSGRTYTQGTTTVVIFNTPVFDTHNGYDSLTGYYSIPIKGKYLVQGKATLYPGPNSNYDITGSITLNGIAIASSTYGALSGYWNVIVSAPCSDIVDCQVGDQIAYEIYYAVYPSANIPLYTQQNTLYIYRIGS